MRKLWLRGRSGWSDYEAARRRQLNRGGRRLPRRTSMLQNRRSRMRRLTKRRIMEFLRPKRMRRRSLRTLSLFVLEPTQPTRRRLPLPDLLAIIQHIRMLAMAPALRYRVRRTGSHRQHCQRPRHHILRPLHPPTCHTLFSLQTTTYLNPYHSLPQPGHYQKDLKGSTRSNEPPRHTVFVTQLFNNNTKTMAMHLQQRDQAGEYEQAYGSQPPEASFAVKLRGT